jgi:hypothetical protein
MGEAAAEAKKSEPAVEPLRKAANG